MKIHYAFLAKYDFIYPKVQEIGISSLEDLLLLRVKMVEAWIREDTQTSLLKKNPYNIFGSKIEKAFQIFLKSVLSLTEGSQPLAFCQRILTVFLMKM